MVKSGTYTTVAGIHYLAVAELANVKILGVERTGLVCRERESYPDYSGTLDFEYISGIGGIVFNIEMKFNPGETLSVLYKT